MEFNEEINDNYIEAFIDTSNVDVLAPQNMGKFQDDRLLNDCEGKKLKKYEKVTISDNQRFLPLIISTNLKIGQVFEQFIQDLGKYSCELVACEI